MPSRAITDAQLEAAIDMRLRKKTIPQIGLKLGVKPNTIDYHLRRLGVFPPGWVHRGAEQSRKGYERSGHTVRKFTPEEDALIEKLDQEGLGYSAIGRRIGRKANSVRARLTALANREACQEEV